MGFLHPRAIFTVIMFSLLAVTCQGKSQVTIQVLSLCSGDQYKRLAVDFQNLSHSLSPDTGNVMVSGIAIFKKKLENLSLKVQVNRCLTEYDSSCREFIPLNCTILCQMLGMKYMMWSTIMENIKNFPKKCPIPKGRYEMDHAYLDLSKMHASLGLPDGNWRATLNFYANEELVTCMYALATVKPVRKRKAQDKKKSKEDS